MEIINRQNNSSFKYYSEIFNLPLVLIEHSNSSFELNMIPKGATIQIPGYIGKTYSISANMTPKKLALLYQIPIEQLLIVNNMYSKETVIRSQKIIIPERVSNLLISDLDHYTTSKLNRDIQQLKAIYPFMVQKIIGYTVMNQPIFELCIGDGDKRIHVNGSFHANEWITTSVIMQFLNEYLYSLTNQFPMQGVNINAYYFTTLLSIVPMVNPDGVNLVLVGDESAGSLQESVLGLNSQNKDFSDWKANIRGVDLNNQFPALWLKEATKKPFSRQPRDYPGEYPLSEPEAKAMAKLAIKRNFNRIITLHTQGEEIYWGFEGMEPLESRKIVNEYSRVTNYLPVQYLDSYAGYKDWFIQYFRRPGYTIELGLGVNPLPFSQFEEIYQKAAAIILINLYL